MKRMLTRSGGTWKLGGVAALALAAGCGTPEPEVSWHKDVSPIMQEHCTRCHAPDGLGIGDFTDLDNVRTFSGRIEARIDEGSMPPATSDPECRDYLGSEHLNLPEAKKDVFRRWVELEMPEGDPELAPELDLPADTLEDADLVLQPPEPYQPRFEDPQNPGNEYRCFVLDHGRDEPFYVTGFYPIVDEPQLVHHVLLLVTDESNIPSDYDPAVGVDCIDGNGIGDISGMIAGWAPGMQPVRFDDGRGIKVMPNQKLIVQTHLFRKGPEVDGLTDRTGWSLRPSPGVATEMLMVPLGYYRFRIPAGDGDYTYDGVERGEGPIELPVSATVHAVFPHMHVLGKRYALSVTPPEGGEDTCVVEGDYDFDNQLSYVLKEPLGVPRGSKINFSCTWDNSAENPDQLVDVPTEVRFGERTDEEMCYAFSLVSLGLPD